MILWGIWPTDNSHPLFSKSRVIPARQIQKGILRSKVRPKTKRMSSVMTPPLTYSWLKRKGMPGNKNLYSQMNCSDKDFVDFINVSTNHIFISFFIYLVTFLKHISIFNKFRQHVPSQPCCTFFAFFFWGDKYWY